jgi:hypothetical protein
MTNKGTTDWEIGTSTIPHTHNVKLTKLILVMLVIINQFYIWHTSHYVCMLGNLYFDL